MFNVTIQEGLTDKLQEMIEDEGDDYCVRLREFKIGSGWHSKIVLGLSIDEFNEDDDTKISINGIEIIAENEFIDKYGKDYTIAINENNVISLYAKEN